jgi:hypothetical protein
VANPNKAKGSRFELEVERELRADGLSAVRPRQTGNVDVGDLHVEDDVVLQAKAWRDVPSALREGVAGAQRQAAAAGRPHGAAVIKRPRGSVAEAYVVMPLRAFAALLRSRRSPSE